MKIEKEDTETLKKRELQMKPISKKQENGENKFIQIGGMGKQKKKAANDRGLIGKKIEKKEKNSSEPLAPATNPVVPKRKMGDLSFFFKKEESISPPTVEQKFSLLHFLKNTSIQVLALQCPNLKLAIQKISKKISVERNLLYGVLEKYFQGGRFLLWSDKYSPKNLNDCLHVQVGKKIMNWLKLFHSYRNTIFQQSNSFIDDYFAQHSNTQLKYIKECGWRLKGLIIKGRSGVGKSSVIFSTAKDMQYQIFNCGNQCNQIKYLKEKNEATQSECVKMKINKNQTQIQKTNKSITSFAVRNQQNQVESQAKRIQFMHNVNNFYPEEDESKFYNELNKTTESSKIPFLMTLTGQIINQSLQIYDVIEFQEANTEDIAKLLFLIYHIEKWLSNCVNLQQIIERQRYKDLLNEQMKNFQFQIVSPFSDFIKLTQVASKKLDFLFHFIEHANKFYHGLNIQQAQKLMKEYLKRSTPYVLMNDYFYVQNTKSNEDDSSKQTIESIDTNRYLIGSETADKRYSQQTKKCNSNLDMPAYASTPNKQQTMLQNLDLKTKTNKKYSKTQMKQENDSLFHNSLQSHLYEIDLKVIQDYKHEVQNDQCFIFNKLYNQQRQQLEDNIVHNVSINSHMKIRKQILLNVKKQFFAQNELLTSLKAKEMNSIGFLIDSRSRVSRKRIIKQELNFRKLLKNNQVNYLKKFTDFLKPNSHEASKL